MNICMLTSSYPKYPGEVTAPFIEEIAAGLAARGHEVHVILPRHRDLHRPAVDRGVHLHPYAYAPLRALNVWGYAESMAADVEVRGRVYLAALFALPAGLLALRRVARQVGADLVHAHWVLPNGPLGAVVAAGLRVPLVVSLHGSDVYLPERHRWLRGVTAWTFRRAAAITACSGDLARRAIALGAPAERMTVIPYGADRETFYPAGAEERARVRAEWGLAENEALVLAVGRLVRKKGFEVLIRAMPQVVTGVGPVRLLIAGQGDLRDELEALARELGVTARVTFPGAVERDRLPALFRACDVLAVPSVHDERGNVDGLPNVVLEGMASGAAIVASDVAGIPQVILPEENGLLVPEKDPEALAGALVRLLRDPALRLRLGQAARRRVEAELNWPAVAARFEEVYARAGAGRDTSPRVRSETAS
jgi:glycosyltransferase involved in cell wall biosynthesis